MTHVDLQSRFYHLPKHGISKHIHFSQLGVQMRDEKASELRPSAVPLSRTLTWSPVDPFEMGYSFLTSAINSESSYEKSFLPKIFPDAEFSRDLSRLGFNRFVFLAHRLSPGLPFVREWLDRRIRHESGRWPSPPGPAVWVVTEQFFHALKRNEKHSGFCHAWPYNRTDCPTIRRTDALAMPEREMQPVASLWLEAAESFNEPFKGS